MDQIVLPPRRLAALGTVGAAIGRRLLDVLLPPQCLGCRSAVDRPGRLCARCWGAVSFIAEPCCAACGLPFDHAAGAGLLCGACSRRRPRYDRARAVLRYDDASRPLILGFKHGDRTEAAAAFAAWMARAGAALLTDTDLVVPVPLHRWRLLRRRYNQSALLAQELGRLAGRPAVVDLLVRRRATASQGGLSARQRRLNVAAAFAVAARRRGTVAGRRVLLVDDVLTTGATVDACARVLRAAGAAGVDVLTLGRVVRGRGEAI